MVAVVPITASLPGSAPALADTSPAVANDPLNPPTVSAEGLPTVQINGVVWAQEVVGNTVYVGGEFSNARPAGSAPGQNTVSRSNLLAYDIRTGVLSTTWAPTSNGTIYDITASPDGSRIYVAGQFTNINGQTKNRIAALNPTNGSVIQSFQAVSDATVRAVAATNTTVYFGGLTTNLNNGNPRTRAAAVTAATGAALPWAPVLANGRVESMNITPDGTKVIIGGSFGSTNGSTNPGRGLALVDATTAALLPLAAAPYVAVGYPGDGAVTSIAVDEDSFYVTAFTFGRVGGTLEGTARIDFNGNLVWVQDCHGDSYGVFATQEVVYVASHAHHCANISGGFAQTDPQADWRYFHAMAWGKDVSGTATTEYVGYTNFAGQPTPTMLHWFPQFNVGTYTGQNQAAWTLDGNADYIVAGGEFPSAGGRTQQGLVRFARPGVGSNADGPVDSGSRTIPRVTSPAPNTTLITWGQNWDRDNEFITYNVIRNGNLTTPAYSVTVSSKEWNRADLSWIDTNPTQDLAPGQQIRYRIFAVDPHGNESRSDTVNLAGNLATADTLDPYAQSVLADGPLHYWRMSEPSGNTVADYTGFEPLTLTGAVTRGIPGAIAGNAATRFPGASTSTGSSPTNRYGPLWYTVEAWFRGGSNMAGKIIGYGNAQSGNSGNNTKDRALYIGSNGTVNFYNRQYSTNVVVTSPGAYRDNNWHHVAGVVGNEGMFLYVDGALVGQSLSTRYGQNFTGYWRVGGDSVSGLANAPSNGFFNAEIDDVAVYRRALTGNQVRDHYLASARSLSIPTDPYGAAVYAAGPNHLWRFGETSGATAGDASANTATGSYTNGPTLGGQSAVGLGSDRSASFDGSNDFVAGPNMPSAAQLAPATYSAQLWFRTTSTAGGRLIGFGNSRTSTLSNVRDRHVYMGTDGRLRFGVQPFGNNVVIQSPGSYNDGQWHMVVATQGPRGMALYVDGTRVASGPQVQARQWSSGTTPNTGYWRVGGDSLSGWPGAGANYFNGSLDEAAVYPRPLTDGEVAALYAAGTGTVPNQPPVAAWTSSSVGLLASFNSSGSNDPDGSIASYSWDFGDSTSSTDANPTHLYTAAGAYLVTLTVTDNQGVSTSLSRSVSVSIVNQPPTAAFTATPNNLTVTFNSGGSNDPDGTITSYLWNFGDSTTSTEANPVKVYAAGGTYNVTLTVTDNLLAQGSTSQPVGVTTPPPAGVIAQDDYNRTVSNGWGGATAPAGATWAINGTATNFRVDNGSGVLRMATAGSGPRATLGSVSTVDSDVTVKISMDKLANAGGAFVSVGSRAIGNNSYRAKVKTEANGRVTLYLVRADPGETTLAQVLLPATLTYAAGQQLNVRLQTQGTNPTTLRAKVWLVGTTEPAAWQLTATDASASLQAAGSFTLVAYLSGSATNAPVEARFDDLNVAELV